MNKKKDLELYIHIPFCKAKCKYCDFVSGPETKEVIDTYFNNLKQEIMNYRNSNYSFGEYQVSTVFFGGGTPSCVDACYITELMDLLRKVFSFDEEEKTEITIEANPGTITRDKLLAYREAGINRLSMGLQSAKEEELRLLGRIHTYQEFLENYNLARECGFQNINIDLMSALPGQDVADWEETLMQVAKLNPEHISAYSLIIEEGTPFFEQYKDREDLLPDEDTEREIYHRTKMLLAQSGYERYEISNYAKKGYACRHNFGYWDRVPYIGMGLSAASLFEEKRFTNPSSFEEYERFVKEKEYHREVEILTKEAQMEEFMFLGLRKIEGISDTKFQNQFEENIESIYGSELDRLIKQGLLQRDDGRIRLTDAGIDISNYVMAKFLLN